MVQLPKNIIILIFQFDSTYKNIYNILLKELLLSTPYWIMKSTLDITNNFHVYRMNQKQAIEKSNYWNNHYNGILSLNKNLTSEQLSKINTNPIIFNYPSYISDLKKEQPYFRDKIYHRNKFISLTN